MTKKEKETIYLNRFRESFLEFPSGEIEACENPDFLIHAETGRIGIEVTRLYRRTPANKSPLQEQEGLRRLILDRARQLYESQARPHIQVTVHFNTQYRLRKRDVESTAKDVVSLVLEYIPEQNSFISLEENENNMERWPETLARVSIRRSSDFTKTTFSSPDAGFVPKLDPELIQSAINQKNCRCPVYRKHCSKVCLLIVVDGLAISSAFTIESEITKHAFVASFDRVFLFENCEKNVFELTI